MDRTRALLRRKTALAVAFAGAIFNSQSTVLAETDAAARNSFIEQIVSADKRPDDCAFKLLTLARYYLEGADQNSIEGRYILWSRSLNVWHHYSSEKMWGELTVQAAGDDWHCRYALTDKNRENRPYAEAAVKQALKQIEQTSSPFAKWSCFLEAYFLFKRMGNTAGAKNCEAVLEKEIVAVEKAASSDDEQLRAASHILQVQAYNILPVDIPVTAKGNKPSISVYSNEDFELAEKKWLRAAALLDRMLSNTDERRRVHRDLSLWYQELGKLDLALSQKQTLFELVGWSDDSLLYPQLGACGQVMWWQKPPNSTARKLMDMCGMG